MTVHINPLDGSLLVTARVVGYFVHKHSARQEAAGDIVGAIVATTSVLTALVLIFGETYRAPALGANRTRGPVGADVAAERRALI
ncbi:MULTISPECIES: hypothetical protein [unclassified Streptomyces]|uniref:hypothetical protein n=1 Tax=unclassified Streptomyces TaxID=2593676 RepID=UPI0037033E0B